MSPKKLPKRCDLVMDSVEKHDNQFQLLRYTGSLTIGLGPELHHRPYSTRAPGMGGSRKMDGSRGWVALQLASPFLLSSLGCLTSISTITGVLSPDLNTRDRSLLRTGASVDRPRGVRRRDGRTRERQRRRVDATPPAQLGMKSKHGQVAMNHRLHS